MKRSGGSVFSTSEAESGYLEDDPDDIPEAHPSGVGAVSEYERAMISLRLKAGRRKKAEAGRYAYGAPPFGYRAEGGELVPDVHEQATLARIKDLHGASRSLREIANTLNGEQIASKRGVRWQPTTVSRVLARGHDTF